MPCPCLGHSLKELIAKAHPELTDGLNKVPDCGSDLGMELVCGGLRRSREKKTGRAPSTYNLFISSCMKGKVKGFGQAAEVMRGCAAQWREKKKGATPVT